MEIEIDEEKIKEIFGDEIISIISENKDIINKNINIMKEFGFNDIDGLFERCPDFFFKFPNKFKEKLNNLKLELGENYIELIESDISLIEGV